MAIKKSKAFTLYEMIIAMVLSAFVLVIAYTAFKIAYKQFHLFKNVEQYSNEIMQFNFAINNDFNNADVILAFPHELQLKSKSKPTIKYKLKPQYILRQMDYITDTFRIEYAKYNYAVNAEAVYAGEINRLVLEIKVAEKIVPISIQKDFGSCHYVNSNLK